MQLIQRAANGDYSKLLEATIANYLQERDKLHIVRSAAKMFLITSQLCAFYDVYVPSIEPEVDEQSWIMQLRRNKPTYELHPPSMKFSELQLTAYMSGAVDYMLERQEVFGAEYDRFMQLAEAKVVKKEAAEFLVEMWVSGFGQQRNRFGNR